MKPRRVNIGDRFGRLTVLRRIGSGPANGGNYPLLECACDCGGTKRVLSLYLTRGNTKSCGCLRKEAMARGQAILAKRRLPKREAAFNVLYRFYKDNAKRRGLQFGLGRSEFEAMASSPCIYCGTPPCKEFNKHGRIYATYNGIDRLENSSGYTISNTAPCCHACNKLKGTLNRFEFLWQVEQVHNNMRLAAKHVGISELPQLRGILRFKGLKLVAATGCFDVIHPAHLALFDYAKSMGDALLVGINSDASVAALKGPGRPIYGQHSRAAMVAGFWAVDHVSIFGDTTASKFLSLAEPDVWVKGGDYTMDTLDRGEVSAVVDGGGRVELFPSVPGYSSTSIIEKMKKGNK